MDIYEFWGGTYCTVHFCLLFYKTEKVQEHDLFLNKILFDVKKTPMMNNKKITKRGSQGAQLLFLYEVSIVVLIDFIAILLTPGIFLMQIVNTNSTNMYLIHFIVKMLLKCVFPKLGFYSLKPISIIHYPSQLGVINCVDISKDFPTMFTKTI